MLAQALVAEADTFVALWKDSKLPDGRDRATASCVTAIGRIARSRPASGLSRFAAPRCATGAR
jgi:hypothetical protein